MSETPIRPAASEPTNDATDWVLARVTPEGAAWVVSTAVIGAKFQKLKAQANGSAFHIPDSAADVLYELSRAAGEDLAAWPDSGPRLVKLDESRGMVAVTVAAEIAGVGAEYVRRLARTGRIRCHRAGPRLWLVDVDSLTRVIRRENRNRSA